METANWLPVAAYRRRSVVLRRAVVRVFPALLFALLFWSPSKACPFDTSAAHLDKSELSELLHTDPLLLDNECFARLIARLTSDRRKPSADSIYLLVEKRFATIALSDSALLAIARYPSTKSYPGLWGRVVRLWEKRNGQAYQHLSGLVNDGRIRLADSLYGALDADSVFDVHDLMRWANVKHVLDQPLKAATLFCRICDREPRLAPVAFSQILHQLGDTQKDLVVSTLGAFRSCYLKTAAADTVLVRNWLADAYARMGMYDKEIETLVELETRSSPVTRQLVESARERFIRGDFKHVIAPAKLAYSKLPKGDVRSLAATLLYQAYLERAQNDSALLWLGRSDLNSQARTVDAVVLYQHAGQFQKAAALLDSLDRGPGRDTLMIRQLVFSGEPARAVQYTATFGPSWRRLPHDAVLWKARALLFDHQIDTLAALLDSADLPSSWTGSTEILKYRYWLQFLGKSKEALELWASVEYDLYCGKPEKTEARFRQKRVGPDQVLQLRLRLAGAFMSRGDPAAALSVLGGADSSVATPEFDYMHADALLRTGDVDKARQILEELVLEHPGDIFSSKARILLSRMQPTS